MFLFTFPFVYGALGEGETESLSHPGCGVIPTSSTIINGSSTYYPWMVFLYNRQELDTDNSFCGGVLISDLEILTTAHCVNGRTIDDMVVIVGSDNAEAEPRKLTWKTLSKIEFYPPYYKSMMLATPTSDPYMYDVNIAILTLEKPLVLTSEVYPICLPSLDESEETYEGKTATVATSERQLMHVEVPILSNDQCLKFYSWIMRFHIQENVSF